MTIIPARWRRCLPVAVLAAGLAAPAAAGAAPRAGFTVKRLTFQVSVGPAHQRCPVVGALYRPAGATARHPRPAILTTNGFGGSYASQSGLSAWLASDGYVVLEYSGLGFGGSGCQIELDSPAFDGEAARQLVSFLGGGVAASDGTRVNYVIHDARAHDGHRYSDDPRVGMIGGSYGGEVQFAAAAVDPRIDTIIPLVTWNDLAYSLAPNNTSLRGSGVSPAVPGDTKFEWLNLFYAVGLAVGRFNPSGVSGPCPNWDPRACPVISELDTVGAPDRAAVAFARQASVATYIHRIRIPVLLGQGEDDTLFTLHEAVATYDALRAQGTPVEMVWQSWGHSGSTPAPGEWDGANGDGLNPNGTVDVEGAIVLGWLAHYLRGTGPAPALDFSFFRPWVHYPGDDAARAYASAPSYPLGPERTLYLSGTGALVSRVRSVRPGTARFLTPASGAPESVSEVSGTNQTVALSDPPGTFARYESAALTRPLDVVGIPTVALRIADPLFSPLTPLDPARGLALFFKLEDIAPDGSATLPDRLIAPARFASLTGPVQVALPGIVHRFAAGDRIALIVAGSDAAYRGETFAQPVSIATGRLHPGVLTLPVAAPGSFTSLRSSR